MGEDRIRRNLTMPEDLDRELSRLAGKGGFSSVCDIIIAICRVFVLNVLAQEGRAVEEYGSIHREIGEMFDELSSYEPTPATTPVPRRHRTKK